MKSKLLSGLIASVVILSGSITAECGIFSSSIGHACPLAFDDRLFFGNSDSKLDIEILTEGLIRNACIPYKAEISVEEIPVLVVGSVRQDLPLLLLGNCRSFGVSEIWLPQRENSCPLRALTTTSDISVSELITLISHTTSNVNIFGILANHPELVKELKDIRFAFYSSSISLASDNISSRISFSRDLIRMRESIPLGLAHFVGEHPLCIGAFSIIEDEIKKPGLFKKMLAWLLPHNRRVSIRMMAISVAEPISNDKTLSSLKKLAMLISQHMNANVKSNQTLSTHIHLKVEGNDLNTEHTEPV